MKLFVPNPCISRYIFSDIEQIMILKNEVDNMLERILVNENNFSTKRINLYAAGVVAKIRNAEYALSKIEEYSKQLNISPNDSEDYNITEKIHFYTDSFFAFLYSSFDVIAQVINQKYHLQIDERRVSIKRIKTQLEGTDTSLAIVLELDRIFRTYHFRNLDKYRNCSTHRRQIFIMTETTNVEVTAGYSISGDLTTVKRIICDDPFSLNPTVKQDRDLVQYTNSIFHKIIIEISKIAKKI